MKALLLKDTIMIWKKMKIVLIAVVVLLMMGEMYFYGLIIGIALPMSLMSFEDQTKWNTYVKMMPYRSSQIVISKYLLSYAILSIITIFGMLVVLAEYILAQNLIIVGFTMYQIPTILILSIASTIFISCYLPVMFKLGFAKGSFCFTGIAFAFIAILSVIGKEAMSTVVELLQSPWFYIVATFCILAINLFSMSLSTKIYKFKN